MIRRPGRARPPRLSPRPVAQGRRRRGFRRARPIAAVSAGSVLELPAGGGPVLPQVPASFGGTPIPPHRVTERFFPSFLPYLMHRTPRLILSVVATTLLAGCGPRMAPACDAAQTEGRAARVTLRLLATGLGEHEIEGDLEHLTRADGGLDTLEIRGSTAVWSAREGRMVASLRNVRPTDRNQRIGSWSCAAEVVLTSTREGAEGSLVAPITYQSTLQSNGDQVVNVSLPTSGVRRL